MSDVEVTTKTLNVNSKDSIFIYNFEKIEEKKPDEFELKVEQSSDLFLASFKTRLDIFPEKLLSFNIPLPDLNLVAVKPSSSSVSQYSSTDSIKLLKLHKFKTAVDSFPQIFCLSKQYKEDHSITLLKFKCSTAFFPEIHPRVEKVSVDTPFEQNIFKLGKFLGDLSSFPGRVIDNVSKGEEVNSISENIKLSTCPCAFPSKDGIQINSSRVSQSVFALAKFSLNTAFDFPAKILESRSMTVLEKKIHSTLLFRLHKFSVDALSNFPLETALFTHKGEFNASSFSSPLKPAKILKPVAITPTKVENSAETMFMLRKFTIDVTFFPPNSSFSSPAKPVKILKQVSITPTKVEISLMKLFTLRKFIIDVTFVPPNSSDVARAKGSRISYSFRAKLFNFKVHVGDFPSR